MFDQFRVGSLLSALGGTHGEEHSLKTPAGQWPRLPFGPGSVESEGGSEKLRKYGRGRGSPPSSFGRWWPQGATPQHPGSPGERWKPIRVRSPALFDLTIHIIYRTRKTLHLHRKQKPRRGPLPESHRKYLSRRRHVAADPLITGEIKIAVLPSCDFTSLTPTNEPENTSFIFNFGSRSSWKCCLELKGLFRPLEFVAKSAFMREQLKPVSVVCMVYLKKKD